MVLTYDVHSTISLRYTVVMVELWGYDEELCRIPYLLLDHVNVFVTSECIHLYILCIIPRCLFWDVFVMYLSHVMP